MLVMGSIRGCARLHGLHHHVVLMASTLPWRQAVSRSGADSVSRGEVRATYRRVPVRVSTARHTRRWLLLTAWPVLPDAPSRVSICGGDSQPRSSRYVLLPNAVTHGVAHVYNHWSGMPPLAE